MVHFIWFRLFKKIKRIINCFIFKFFYFKKGGQVGAAIAAKGGSQLSNIITKFHSEHGNLAVGGGKYLLLFCFQNSKFFFYSKKKHL